VRKFGSPALDGAKAPLQIDIGFGDAVEVARNRVDGLLGHFHTKIMHQNDCDVTNNKMSEIIAKDLWWRSNKRTGAAPGRNEDQTWVQQLDYVLPPIAFKQLKRGGKKNNWDVRAIVTMPEHQWSDGKWWKAVKMIQNCEPHKDRILFQFLYDHSPATMWFDLKPIARNWVRHVPFLQLCRDVWNQPKAAHWLLLRWLSFWVGIDACMGDYEKYEKEINHVDQR
jgi:hypothetical protein